MVKKILIIILVILFIFAGALLIKLKTDIDNAKKYTNFITESANTILTDVETINLSINDFEYSQEADNDTKNLRQNLTAIKSSYSDVLVQRESFKMHYGAEDLDDQFDIYLERVNELILSYEAMLKGIEDLDTKEDFEGKLEDYIGCSNGLQDQSRVLEQEINEFVNDYTNFNIKNIPDAIKSI